MVRTHALEGLAWRLGGSRGSRGKGSLGAPRLPWVGRLLGRASRCASRCTSRCASRCTRASPAGARGVDTAEHCGRLYGVVEGGQVLAHALGNLSDAHGVDRRDERHGVRAGDLVDAEGGRVEVDEGGRGRQGVRTQGLREERCAFAGEHGQELEGHGVGRGGAQCALDGCWLLGDESCHACEVTQQGGVELSVHVALVHRQVPDAVVLHDPADALQVRPEHAVEALGRHDPVFWMPDVHDALRQGRGQERVLVPHAGNPIKRQHPSVLCFLEQGEHDGVVLGVAGTGLGRLEFLEVGQFLRGEGGKETRHSGPRHNTLGVRQGTRLGAEEHLDHGVDGRTEVVECEDAREEVVARQAHHHGKVLRCDALACQGGLQGMDVDDLGIVLADEEDAVDGGERGQDDQVGVQAVEEMVLALHLELGTRPVKVHDLVLALAGHPVPTVDHGGGQGEGVAAQPCVQVGVQALHELCACGDAVAVKGRTRRSAGRRKEPALTLLLDLGRRRHPVHGEHKHLGRMDLDQHFAEFHGHGDKVLTLQHVRGCPRHVRHALWALSAAIAVDRLSTRVEDAVGVDRERRTGGRVGAGQGPRLPAHPLGNEAWDTHVFYTLLFFVVIKLHKSIHRIFFSSPKKHPHGVSIPEYSGERRWLWLVQQPPVHSPTSPCAVRRVPWHWS